jgi:hypothetical protein
VLGPKSDTGRRTTEVLPAEREDLLSSGPNAADVQRPRLMMDTPLTGGPAQALGDVVLKSTAVYEKTGCFK